MKKTALSFILFLMFLPFIYSHESAPAAERDYIVTIVNRSFKTVTFPCSELKMINILKPGDSVVTLASEKHFYDVIKTWDRFTDLAIIKKLNYQRSISLTNKPILLRTNNYTAESAAGQQSVGVEICIKGTCDILFNKYPQHKGYVIITLYPHPTVKGDL